MLKKATNKKTIAITVLAVLLVALLAFNVTYAYFTDQTETDMTLNFGVVDVNATGLAVSGATAVMPGDKLTLAGTISLTNTTDAAGVWLKVGVITGEDNANIKLYYGTSSTEIKAGDENAYYDGTAADGEGYAYTAGDITAMKEAVADALTEQIVNVVNTTTGNTGLLSADGVSAALVAKTKSIDLGTAGTKLTLDPAEFGNLFQNVKVVFQIGIQAIQGSNVTRTQALAAFEKSEADFLAGTFTL